MRWQLHVSTVNAKKDRKYQTRQIALDDALDCKVSGEQTQTRSAVSGRVQETMTRKVHPVILPELFRALHTLDEKRTTYLLA